jgi:hypothetical protein
MLSQVKVRTKLIYGLKDYIKSKNDVAEILAKSRKLKMLFSKWGYKNLTIN